MILKQFDIYKYSLRLNRPLKMRGQEFSERNGLLLKVTDDQSNVGWAEVAPLPGVSAESLDEALESLKSLRYRIKNSSVPQNLGELSGGFKQWFGDIDMPPSVQCGFEVAILSLEARVHTLSLAQVLSDQPLPKISINALISTERVSIEKEIKRVISSNYHTVKVKVGRQSIEDDIAMVQQVCAAAGGSVSVRLDANRAWRFDDALRFTRAIEECGVEYLEEPLSEAVAMEAFSRETQVPVALDESLADYTPETLPLFPGVGAIILRPMLLGGFERAMMFARRARAQDVRTVVSSAVESAIGIAALANLAAAMNPTDTAVGLDTMSWFEEQPIRESIAIEDGQMDPAHAFNAAQNVDDRMLEEVTDA